MNKYNNTDRITIKIRPADIKSSTYIDFNSENNKEGPKFKIKDNLIISNYKKFFANGCLQNWSEEAFVIKNVKVTVSWTYITSSFNDKEVVGKFYKKESHKQIKNSFEKIIKRKDNKLYVAWK